MPTPAWRLPGCWEQEKARPGAAQGFHNWALSAQVLSQAGAPRPPPPPPPAPLRWHSRHEPRPPPMPRAGRGAAMCARRGDGNEEGIAAQWVILSCSGAHIPHQPLLYHLPRHPLSSHCSLRAAPAPHSSFSHRTEVVQAQHPAGAAGELLETPVCHEPTRVKSQAAPQTPEPALPQAVL